MDARVQIAGMPRLLRKLKVLPDAVRKELRLELAKHADDVVAMMKGLVPVSSGMSTDYNGQPKKPGALKDSIGWAWGNKVPKGAMAIATSGKGDLSITIYAGNKTAYYAKFVEFGTAAHIAGGKFEGAKIPDFPGKPFFWPSWRAMRKDVKKALRVASRNAAKKVAAS